MQIPMEEGINVSDGSTKMDVLLVVFSGGEGRGVFRIRLFLWFGTGFGWRSWVGGLE